MAIDTTHAATHDWTTVLGRVRDLDGAPRASYGVLEGEPAGTYGVAIEAALEDLAAAAASGRPLAPYLREATRVGCPQDQILLALDELRSSGVAAPPL